MPIFVSGKWNGMTHGLSPLHGKRLPHGPPGRRPLPPRKHLLETPASPSPMPTEAFLAKSRNRGFAESTFKKYQTFVKQLRICCDQRVMSVSIGSPSQHGPLLCFMEGGKARESEEAETPRCAKSQSLRT